MVNLERDSVRLCKVLALLGVIIWFLGCSSEIPTSTPAPVDTATPQSTATLATSESSPTPIMQTSQGSDDSWKPRTLAAPAVPISDSPMLPFATPDVNIVLQQGEKMAPSVFPDVTPTPESVQDICARNPELQWAIIEKLKISSCQVINASELFRMRKLAVVTSVPPQPGDFADMPNLLQLEVTSEHPLPSNVFVGLSGLRRLSIKLGSNQSEPTSMIEPHTFAGLENLQSLNVTVEEQRYIDLKAQTLAGLGSLQQLGLNQVRSVGVGALVELPVLKVLELEALRLWDEVTGEYLPEQKLGGSAFSQLPALESLSLRNFELSPTMDFYSPTVLCNLPTFGSLGFDELEAVTIGGQPAEVLQEWDWDEDNCLVEVGNTIVKVDKPDDWDRR